MFVLYFLVSIILYFFFHYFLLFLYFILEIPAQKSTKNCETNSEDTSTVVGTSAQQQSRTMSETEFVSDTFHTTNKDLEEVNAGIKKLGIDTLATQVNKNGKTNQSI